MSLDEEAGPPSVGPRASVSPARLGFPEEHQRLLVETSQEGILAYDARLLTTYVNGRMAELLGYTPEELVGVPIARFIVAEELPDHESRLALRQAGRADIYERRLVRRDGGLVWCRVSSTPLGDAEGRFAGAFVMCTDITEQRHAELARRESEERYRVLLEASPTPILAISGGHFVFANAAGCQLLGRDLDGIVGLPALDVIPPERREIVRTRLAEVAKGRRNPRILMGFLRPDGTIVETEALSVPVRLDGRPAALVLCEDLTERRRAEATLRESEARLHAFFDNSPAGMAIIDRDLRYVVVNESLAALNGLPASAHVGRPLGDVLEGASEPVGAAVRRVVETGRPVTLEGGIYSPRLGTEVSASVHIFPLQRADGAVVSAGVVVLDQTERVRGERALRDRERELAKAQALAHVGSYSWAPGARELRWSDEVHRITGVETGEVTFEEMAAHVHPDDRGPLLDFGSRALAGGVAFDREYRIVRPDGEVRWVHDVADVERDAEGRVVRVFGALQDTTELRRAEEERLELERRLLHGQKLESLGVLAGGIAHDFNNLLLAVTGNLDLALLDLPPFAPARESIEYAMRACRRAVDLSREMLAYSGRGRIEVRRVDLGDLVRENVHLFRAAVARSVTMDVTTESELPAVEADPGQVQQVVMNLITNASEALGETAGLVRLTVRAIECAARELAQSCVEDKPSPGRFVSVQVEDTGMGMDAETRRRLFDPFFSTKFTGRGLGMAAVIGIVRGHRGAIFVDSEVGRGTTIRVLFPACADGPADAAPVLPAATLPPRRYKGTVLVVDDEDLVRDQSRHMMRRLGFDVLEACDGDEAVRAFREHGQRIALVLLDLTMPRMDGVTALAALRSMRPDVRVILTSGYDEADVQRRIPVDGAVAFLQKPYRMTELEEKLRLVLA